MAKRRIKKIPKSMVIHLGSALQNHSLTQLVRDTRNLMQPHTAINLRERKNNKLKDFVVMAGPLGVSQLMVFSQSEDTGSTHLRMSSMPRGPTITFKIHEYSLCRDVAKILKTPKSVSRQAPEFTMPPLLVMNGFKNPKESEMHEKLLVTMFQQMFPPVSPQHTKVDTIRRVLMLNKDKDTGIIELRHYFIDTKLVDVSKNVKRLINVKRHVNKKLPNLAKVKDVADVILDPYANAGFTSDSEVEDDAIVEVQEKSDYLTRPKNAKSAASGANGAASSEQEEQTRRKKAVKLTEVGPRMRLELIKIEEGVCEGKVLYHSYIKKTQKEINKLDQQHAVKRKERENRKKEQEFNVQKKKEKKEAKKKRREERRAQGEAVSESEEESEDEIMSDYSDYNDYEDKKSSNKEQKEDDEKDEEEGAAPNDEDENLFDE
ncbi:hypothetical protein B5S27_g1649 [[Candida] boidinii]|nr:hypothetical protein B5S27_g1649 [[Candida] boidinii]